MTWTDRLTDWLTDWPIVPYFSAEMSYTSAGSTWQFNPGYLNPFKCGSYTFKPDPNNHQAQCHYNDVIISEMASQITSLTIVYSTVYLGVGQRKHQSSASLAFVRGIHRGQVNSLHQGPVTRKMFPFDDVIMLMTDVHVVFPNSLWHLVILKTFLLIRHHCLKWPRGS